MVTQLFARVVSVPLQYSNYVFTHFYIRVILDISKIVVVTKRS